jgi:hypothetical protein
MQPLQQPELATCAGPISVAAAIAAVAVAPDVSSKRGRWAAMAPVTNPTAPNTKANTTIPFAGERTPGSRASLRDRTPDNGMKSRLIGRQTKRFSAAQPRQAPRHPKLSFSKAESGQPTVLAKPPIKVMPVIGPRAWQRLSHKGRAPYLCRVQPRRRLVRLDHAQMRARSARPRARGWREPEHRARHAGRSPSRSLARARPGAAVTRRRTRRTGISKRRGRLRSGPQESPAGNSWSPRLAFASAQSQQPSASSGTETGSTFLRVHFFQHRAAGTAKLIMPRVSLSSPSRFGI